MAQHDYSQKFYVLLLAALVLCFCVPSFGQSEDATLSGTITDPSGAIVPGAQVKLTNVDTLITAATRSNNSGLYVFSNIHPGQYRMVVEKAGFRQVVLTDLTLNVQDVLSRNVKLQLGVVGESVTVSGAGEMVKTDSGAVSTVIDSKFVESMPLNGRSFQDLLTLAPGVTLVGGGASFGNATPGPGSAGEMSVNGLRTEANYFTVDGVSATVGTSPGDVGSGAGFGGATPAASALGSTQPIVPVDDLQEFRASTSTYSAELGRTPGGQFSFTTRSGANTWHGSTYEYFRNDAMDANNWFLDQLGQSRSKERQNDFGGTLGGPVIIPDLYNGKNKTFFFFTYEGLRLVTPQGLQTFGVPDDTLRTAAPAPLQPILNAFPMVNNGEDGLNDGLGFYSTGISFPSTLNSTTVRIDHHLSNKFSLFARFADTPTTTSTYAESVETSTIINNRSLTVGTTATISSRQTNELRFNITQSNSEFGSHFTSLGGAVPFDVTTIPGPNGGSFPAQGSVLSVCLCYGSSPVVNLGQVLQNAQRQYNLTDTHSWMLGRHLLKFGGDWRRLSTRVTPITSLELEEFFSEASVLANQADLAIAQTVIPSPVEPMYHNFSAFAQDEWKVTAPLTLSLGLRWDVNPPPTNLTGPSPYTVDQITNLATTKLAPAGTPLWQTDWRGFGPRLGIAYQVRQTPGRETVVRGGLGKFFDMGNSLGSNGFNGIGFSNTQVYFGSSFPLTSAQITLPPASVDPPYSNTIYAFDPHLKLPDVWEWNVAVEQALGKQNALTVTYLGSAGRRLLATFQYAPENLGNPNFDPNVCPSCLLITKNGTTSDYDALQVQFQRRLSRGLQTTAFYAWSHSIDEASSNFQLYSLVRASSNFDIRHNFQAAITYEIPGRHSNQFLSALLEHWGMDTRISARSALPVDIKNGPSTIDPATLTTVYTNPNIVPGQRLYIYGSQYPGGRILNYNAFQATAPGVEGTAGRNSARAFGASQVNFALRREFPIHERLKLQFRAEAFNIFNHPNFGWVNGYLISGPCGQPQPHQSLNCFGVAVNTLNNALNGLNSLYQSGGPRSLQLMLKLAF